MIDKEIAYIALGFENVEGIFIRANIIKHLVLTHYDKLHYFVNGEPILSTTETMNYVKLIIEKEKLLRPENLDFRHMHESNEKEALDAFKKHLFEFPDIVDISLCADDFETMVNYYVHWADGDEYINRSVNVTEKDGMVEISIIKPGCE